MKKLILIFFNTFLIILLIPILLAIALSGKKNRQDFFYCINERVVLTPAPQLDKTKKTVWLHCSSLGEAKALEPLLKYLTNYNIVITSITKSAREYVAKLPNVTYYSLAPVDFYPFVVKKIKQISPDILILIETEFWPNMIYLAKKFGTKIYTVNGRISKSAFPGYKLTKLFWRPFLQLIDFVCVRNEFDYNRFATLIGNTDKIKVTGNIKYDRDFGKETITRESLNYSSNDLILVAGSIRGEENNVIIEVYKSLKNRFQNLKLIIAPRHLTKIEELKTISQNNGLKYSLFSKLENSVEDILLVDVFGKLQKIYSISDVVFVGGSIAKTGGQNPIEPAAYSKPIVFGKYMYNFEIESKLLKDYKGAVEVLNKRQLQEELYKLLIDKQLRIQTGQNALKTVQMQKGAIANTLKTLEII